MGAEVMVSGPPTLIPTYLKEALGIQVEYNIDKALAWCDVANILRIQLERQNQPLFSSLRDKKINIAVIGIEKNGSIKLWREYFKKASIYGFEYDKKKIKIAKSENLKKTNFYEINVHDKNSIYSSFHKTKVKFDIIIDDSTHLFDDQIRVIENSFKFLKTNGIMIIEDIYRLRSDYQEHKYFNKLARVKKYFHEIFFIETKHANNFTASWKNEKILLLLRNDLK
jgi:SAM-dependent methyltransferase